MSEYIEIERGSLNRGMPDYEKIGVEVVRKCLLDWEGVVDDEGNPVKFNSELIDLLPGNIISILFLNIRTNTGIEETKKN